MKQNKYIGIYKNDWESDVLYVCIIYFTHI